MRGYGWRGCAIAERFRGDSAPSQTNPPSPFGLRRGKPLKPKKERKTRMKGKTETKGKSDGLKLTEQQIADFTKLAELQKDDEANSDDRKLITNAYKAFMVENHDALAAKGGVRAGKLKVWIEVKRTLRADIVE